MAPSFENIQSTIHDASAPVCRETVDGRTDLGTNCTNVAQHREMVSCPESCNCIPNSAASIVTQVPGTTDKINRNQTQLLSVTFYNSNISNGHQTHQNAPVFIVSNSTPRQSTLDPGMCEIEGNSPTSDILSYEDKGTVFFLQNPNVHQSPVLHHPAVVTSSQVDYAADLHKKPSLSRQEGTTFFIQKPNSLINPRNVQTIQLPNVAKTPISDYENTSSTDSWLRRQQARNRLKEWLWKSNHKMLFLACLYLTLTGADKKTRSKN